MGRSSEWPRFLLGLVLSMCHSSCQSLSELGKTANSSIAHGSLPASESAPDLCGKPEIIEVGDESAFAPKKFSGKSVVLNLVAPRLRGRDGSAVDARLEALIRARLASGEADWVQCQRSSKLGLSCAEWRIDTECKVIDSRHFFSVVCIHRLSDELGGRPSVDYTSINMLRCEGNLVELAFERDLCPGRACINDLRTALIGSTSQGDRQAVESVASDASDFICTVEQFAFTDSAIVFLAGDKLPRKLKHNEDFVFGQNVLLLPYDKARLAMPALEPLLEHVR